MLFLNLNSSALRGGFTLEKAERDTSQQDPFSKKLGCFYQYNKSDWTVHNLAFVQFEAILWWASKQASSSYVANLINTLWS